MGMPTNQPVHVLFFNRYVFCLAGMERPESITCLCDPMRGERILGRHFGYWVIAVRFDFQTVAFET